MKVIKFMKNFIISIILAIVCNVSNKILITSGQYIPAPRYAASSEIIGDRLYVIGGQVSSTGIISGGTTSREVVYLDLSKDFNRGTPPWVDYSQGSLPVLNSWAASCKDNETIYVFGGVIEDINTYSDITDSNKQIHVFNTVASTWTSPFATGADVAPIRRRETKIVMDNLGRIYIFAGLSDPATGSNITTWYNDMTIFDSKKFIWTRINPSGPPSLRADFTATYLPRNGLIVYIGGRLADTSDVNINEILTFDTVSLSWTNKTAGGVTISNRNGHSAVLTSDYRIICYGGMRNYDTISSSPQVVVLNVLTDDYQWLAPVNATTNQPPGLLRHIAELYQDTMIVAFGNTTQSGGTLNKEVFLLDTKTYTWLTSFQSNSSTPPISPINNNSTTSDSQQSNSPIGVIIGASIGGSLVVVISGIAIAFFIVKHRKRTAIKQNIETVSSADYNEMRPASSQDILEIPSSIDRNKMRPNSQYYFSQS